MRTLPRFGIGYDIHRLKEGRKLMLGGVEVPFTHGALGHSDGDVILHAVSDAILGAIAHGDIGVHFSDRDPANEGLASRVILESALGFAAGRGFAVHQVDVNLLIERPRIAPHRKDITYSLAALLKIPLEDVSLKCRTNEGLDAIGRGEALACHALAVLKPVDCDKE